MLHRIAAIVFAVSVVAGPGVIREADACGIKLTVKTPKRVSMRSRAPTRTMEGATPIAAREDRTPVAAGPERTDRTPVNRGTDAAAPKDGGTKASSRTAVAVNEPKKEPKPEQKAQPKPEPKAPTPTPPSEPAKEEVATSVQPPPETKTVKQPVEKPVKVAQFQRVEVHFVVGHSDVNASMKKSLARTASYLAANPDASIVVEGHADPTGQPDMNMALSQKRAEAVRDHLVEAGVDSGRIEVKAFGDTQLKYGRSDGRNRRVVVDLVK